MLNDRYRIALLVSNITDGFSNSIAVGAMRAVERLGADLTIFPGKYIGLTESYDKLDITYEYQYNVLFDHAAEGGFDYIIAVVGTIAFVVDAVQQKRFLESLGDTPILSVCADVDGFDSLCFDNRTGIAAIVDELAEQGRKHIGLMAGDTNNTDAAERCAEFFAGLERHGIDFPERYCMPCEMAGFCNKEIKELLDRAPELDAIVCVNDATAAVVYEELKSRGIVIGKDIAVTGFDDMEGADRLSPPLATVRADPEKLGERSVEMVINRLNGIPDNEDKFPTVFIHRSSIDGTEYPEREYEKLDHDEKEALLERMELRDHLEKIFIRDALMFGTDLKLSYAKIMRQFSLLGADSAYLYTLDKPISHRPDEAFPKNLTWRLRSYCIGKEVFSVPEDKQKMNTREVFNNEYLYDGSRRSFIVADLYVAENQYGIMLIEPNNKDYFSELELTVYILSSAIRTLDILHEQEKLLGKLRTANLALEKQSQIDALTGLYNRRGFYHAFDKLLEQNGESTEYVFCYADMDNLKLVNDRYGHNEGDFALRLVAECLRAVFGENAVIGRFGGDEYAAAAVAAKDADIGEYTAAKTSFVDAFNQSGEKPYLFGVSMGVLKCRCENGYDLRSALDKADDLLYIQKQKRKKEI